MARKKNAIPSYLLHQSSGQARVRVNGHDYLLGEYLSPESMVQYGALVARVNANLPPLSPLAKSTSEEDPGPSVAELIVAFKAHAAKHYTKNGVPTSEIDCYEACYRILRPLYGLTPIKDFGPLALKAVRTKMIEKKWARSNINVMVGRVRRMWKFAVENEMVSVDVLTRLQSVSPLLRGRDHGAPDRPKRHAVDQVHIEAVRQRVRPLVRDLIDLQLATGARSGELLALTPAMIDRTKETWTTVLDDHKCAHHGLRRMIPFGKKAREIISKYLSDDPDKPLFDIERTSYCRAVTRACTDAKIPRWSPHWLRHTYVTRARAELGVEAARAVAGHTTTDMTDVYSSQMDALAIKTAEALG
ncbi:tyrosine-type recombinase/integrase [Schlesneria paludicola]|uniref:tyrosine-type recombinase/integrase n=1 Tax=Schlesneria paludicola TaxID=360056 RepID=UPI00029AC347|nr:tyrosine-type recombinase/integrase [Schlesneria paludicola]